MTSLIPLALAAVALAADTPDGTRVPAAYVLDAGGKVAWAVGYPGSLGRPCRSDLDEVAVGQTCQAEDPNPLQAAIDWATAHGLRDVRLDAAEYTFPAPRTGWIGRIGFYVPSGIHLKGVLRGGEPASVLMPGPEVDPVGAGVPPPQQFEALLLPSGSLTDKSTPLVDTTIEAVMLNNRLLGGVCMWTSGGTGFKLLCVHSMGSRQSSLIVGNWDEGVEAPDVPGRAAIYYMSNFELGWNHVHGANGDGICTIGRNGYVHDNLCENGTSLLDNGITPFIGSSGIRFINNRIVDFPAAIGLDGAFMACAKLPGIDDPQKARAESMRMLWEVHHGWEGYHRGHEIAGNIIDNCRRGIVLHRAAEIRIHGNHIAGRGIGEGLAIEEASSNTIWGNQVKGFATACTLYAHEYSGTDDQGVHMGASLNAVGVDPTGAVVGNDFRGNERGIALIRSHPDGHVGRNVIRGNDCSGCTVPFDFAGGDEGASAQTVSDNLPGDAEHSLPPAKVRQP